LKIRGSWGRLGNANTDQFAYVSRVAFTPQYPLGTGNVPTQAPIAPSLPNKELGWETVQSFDFGFDATLLSKITFLATYYKRNTYDFCMACLSGLPVVLKYPGKPWRSRE
jgi:hypothetical protein